MGPFSFRWQENGFYFLLMPSWLLMAPLIMEEEARMRTKKEQAWLRAEEEAEMKAAIWVSRERTVSYGLMDGRGNRERAGVRAIFVSGVGFQNW